MRIRPISVMCFRDGQPLALRILGQTSASFISHFTPWSRMGNHSLDLISAMGE